MNGYLRDVLLAISVIGAPIIFVMLLYYGLTTKDRNHHHEKQATETRDNGRAEVAPKSSERQARDGQDGDRQAGRAKSADREPTDRGPSEHAKPA